MKIIQKLKIPTGKLEQKSVMNIQSINLEIKLLMQTYITSLTLVQMQTQM